jgi:anti-sigma factor RsiW
MGKIIGFGSDRHRRAQEALPWYVTDQLDTAERAEIDEHLVTCAACRRDLEVERDLAAHIVALPMSADAGWEVVRRRIHGRNKVTSRQPLFSAVRDLLFRPTRMGWVLAGQVLAIVAVGSAYMGLPRQSTAEYHALSAAPAPRAGNVVAMFRPEVSEQQLRSVLLAHHASIVDGPNASGAYILTVPDSERAKTLTEFQQSKDLVLAQPIDSVPAR